MTLREGRLAGVISIIYLVVDGLIGAACGFAAKASFGHGMLRCAVSIRLLTPTQAIGNCRCMYSTIHYHFWPQCRVLSAGSIGTALCEGLESPPSGSSHSIEN